MQQHTIKSPKGAKRNRKVIGRGDGSGHGSYSGKGMKGQKARTGPHIRPGFEGGQLPLYLRLPAIRGFNNIFRVEYEVVNLDRLNAFQENSTVGPQQMLEAGLLKNPRNLIKVLGRGKLEKALTVAATKFSKSAKEKIEAAGGTISESP